jgi:hypothetical protein
MAGDSSVLQALMQETSPLAQAISVFGLTCLADAGGIFSLASGWTSGPLAAVAPFKNVQQQLDALIDQMAPPPPADALPESQVAGLFIQASGSGADLSPALGELAKLSWSSRFQVLRDLSHQGPSLDGQTYLEIIEGTLSALPSPGPSAPPDPNSALHAAMIAILMGQGGRSLSAVDILMNFTLALVLLDERDQWYVLSQLGLNGLAIEGTMADYTGAAMAAGMAVIPQVLQDIMNAKKDTTDILKWELPGKQPKGLYIGRIAHEEIAIAYRAENPSPPHVLATNSTPIESIVTAIIATLTNELQFKGDRVALALALSRPDIFDYLQTHPLMQPGWDFARPPAWIYEIKPCNPAGIARAEIEALFYSDVLIMIGIPTLPGPTGAPGTFGCLPAPGGWFAYTAVTSGAIVYYYRQATPEEILARGLDPALYQAPQKTTQQMANALKAAGATASVAVAAGAAAALADALADAGWALLFLLAL